MDHISELLIQLDTQLLSAEQIYIINDQLNASNKDLQNQLIEQQALTKSLQQELQIISESYQQQKKQLTLLKDQIEIKDQICFEIQSQYTGLQEDYNTLIAQLNLSKSMTQLSDIQTNNQQIKQNIINLQNQNEQLQQLVIVLETENQLTHSKIEQKSSLINQQDVQFQSITKVFQQFIKSIDFSLPQDINKFYCDDYINEIQQKSFNHLKQVEHLYKSSMQQISECIQENFRLECYSNKQSIIEALQILQENPQSNKIEQEISCFQDAQTQTIEINFNKQVQVSSPVRVPAKNVFLLQKQLIKQNKQYIIQNRMKLSDLDMDQKLCHVQKQQYQVIEISEEDKV